MNLEIWASSWKRCLYISVISSSVIIGCALNGSVSYYSNPVFRYSINSLAFSSLHFIRNYNRGYSILFGTKYLSIPMWKYRYLYMRSTFSPSECGMIMVLGLYEVDIIPFEKMCILFLSYFIPFITIAAYYCLWRFSHCLNRSFNIVFVSRAVLSLDLIFAFSLTWVLTRISSISSVSSEAPITASKSFITCFLVLPILGIARTKYFITVGIIYFTSYGRCYVTFRIHSLLISPVHFFMWGTMDSYECDSSSFFAAYERIQMITFYLSAIMSHSLLFNVWPYLLTISMELASSNSLKIIFLCMLYMLTSLDLMMV